MKRYCTLFIVILLASMGIARSTKPAANELLVRDCDGNTYKTVEIGTQVWMAENLQVTHYQDGTPIPNVSSDDAWSKLTTGALCWYENDPSTYKDVYGALYNYYAVIDGRKLCPIGWHIPTKEEWLILENYLGGREIAGDKMKYFDSGLWKAMTPGGGNESGFCGIPAGGRGRLGSFGEGGEYATWWTATAHDPDFAWHWGLFPDQEGTRSNPGHKASGFSVRCVMDE